MGMFDTQLDSLLEGLKLEQEAAKTLNRLALDPSEPTIQKTPNRGAEEAFHMLGDAGGRVGSLVGGLVEGVENRFPVPSASSLTDPLMEAAYKHSPIPGMLSAWEEGHNKSYRLAESALGASNLVPFGYAWGKTIPRAVNAGTDNLATRLDGKDIYGNKNGGSGRGFYDGDPINGIMQGFSFEEWKKQLYNPQSIANREKRGFGQHRMDELMESNKGHAVGNMRASLHMNEAKGRGGKASGEIAQMPSAVAGIKGTVRGNDDAGFAALMTERLPNKGADLPEHVRKKFIDDDRKRLGERSGKEGVVAEAFQMGRGVPDPKDAIIHVADPTKAWNELTQEVFGNKSATGGSVGRALKSEKSLNWGATAYGKSHDKWSPDEWLDYYRTNAAFERGAWQNKKEFQEKLAKEKNPVKKFLGQKLMGKEGGPEGTKAASGKDSQSLAKQKYWSARRRIEEYEADPLTKSGKPKAKPPADAYEFYNYVEDWKKKNPNVAKLTKDADGNEYIDYVGSFVSEEQALGGVGYRISHDLTNKNVYSNGIDGHDMMGADPVGGQQVWNFTPIEQYKVGKPPRIDKTPQKADPVFQKAMNDLESRSGLTWDKANETAEAFQKRVLLQEAPVKLRHYAQPVKDAAAIGGMFTDFDAPTTEEQTQ